MEQQITNSDFRAWFQVHVGFERDEGHSLEFRNGRVIVDGMTSVDSYRSARELMSDAA
jgi:hypothetical protein